MIAIAKQTARYLARTWSMTALGAALALSLAACDNQTGFSGSVGNTPNGPKLASYQILGTVGTSFVATVSDSRSSWSLKGNAPLNIIICNNILPARVIATKTSGDNSLLSVEFVLGTKAVNIQSTAAPFGTVEGQVGGTLTTIAPPADPDLRIFVSGPEARRYSALVEDIDTGFVIASRAPTLILFDNPNGKVDATLFGGQDFGTFTANMELGGEIVLSLSGGPNLTIRQP